LADDLLGEVWLSIDPGFASGFEKSSALFLGEMAILQPWVSYLPNLANLIARGTDDKNRLGSLGNL
jgi:hypothetical protein